MSAPIAKKIPVTRTFHGDTYTDNYEWFRDKESQDLIDLLNAENAHTTERTSHLGPFVESIVGEIASRTREDDTSVPVRYGDWWYMTRTWEGKAYSATFRLPVNPDAPNERPDAQAEWLPVWDGNELAKGEQFFSTSQFLPSPDGTIGALGVDFSGDEHFTLRVFNLASGTILDEVVHGISSEMCWTADGTGILYVRVDAAWRPWQVWLHRIGTPASEDRLLCEERDERFSLWIAPSRDGKWAVLHALSSTTTEAKLFDLENVTAEPILVRCREHGLDYNVEPAGDELLIVHNQNNVDFEVAVAPIGYSDPEEWTPLVTAGEGERISRVDAFADFAVVSMRSEGRTQLRVIPRTEEGWGEAVVVPVPDAVTVEIADNRTWEADSFTFAVESLITPRTTCEYTPADASVRTLKVLDVPNYSREDYIEESVWVKADDDVLVPVTLVRRADVQPDGTNPGRIYGYGSYEISTDPWFDPKYISYLQRGVVIAYAHIRGGGEMGRSWYDDGKLLAKRNTFTDFVAVAKWLHESGWVAPDRLAAEGRSAGGLLMGAVANLAPEQFRAIHAGVPFVDTLTTILNPELPLTVGEWEEWGNPIESAEVYEYMKSYSPTENVREVEYPAILATTSLNDIRVSYVEPTKWVQILRETATNGDDRPILEKIEMVAGHAGVTGRYARWEQEAFIIAWLMDQIGVTA